MGNFNKLSVRQPDHFSLIKEKQISIGSARLGTELDQSPGVGRDQKTPRRPYAGKVSIVLLENDVRRLRAGRDRYFICGRLKLLEDDYLDLFEALAILKVFQSFGQAVVKNRNTAKTIGSVENDQVIAG